MFSQMSADEDGAVEFEDTNVNNLPEVVIDRAETKRLIAEIMDDIPEEQRVAIAMHYLEGIPIKEIAETFGVTENTIKSRLNYGKKKVEVQVKELEKKGTKLYSLAPLPFLLLLFRNQEVHAAELPNFEVLRAIENEFGIKKAVQQPQAINTVTQNVSSISSTATKTVAGTASKGIAAKVIAGIVAVAVIGGGVVAVHNKLNNKTEPVAVEEVQQEEPEVVAPESEVVAPESEVVAPESEVEVPAAISIEEFEGTYQCPDTSLEIIITKIDDTTADIVMDNISPNGANAFNQQMIGKLEGEQLVIDFETSENDMGYITKAGDSLNVDISEHYQAKANTYMSGVYLISGNIENSENTENSGNAEEKTIDDFLGTYETRGDGDHLEISMHLEHEMLNIGSDEEYSYRVYESYKIEGNVLYAYFDNSGSYESYTLNDDGSLAYDSNIEDDWYRGMIYYKKN